MFCALDLSCTDVQGWINLSMGEEAEKRGKVEGNNGYTWLRSVQLHKEKPVLFHSNEASTTGHK